jgi:exosortase
MTPSETLSPSQTSVERPAPARWRGARWLAPVVVVAGCLFWAYWPALREMVQRWSHDPQYSHGYLVPLFAVYLLWSRRDRLAAVTFRTSWWGVLVLVGGAALYLAGAYVFFGWLSAMSLLAALAGLALLFGGAPALRWAWPAIAFLVFMVPLPYRLQTALGLPLQRMATVASTYALQTFGLPALAEGNIIILNEGKMGVEEACSGLSMLFIFFALSVAVAIVSRRPVWEKLLLVASAVPIAIVANVSRITLTGVLQETVGPRIAHAVFHEWGGWLMMPLALGLLWMELKLLSALLVEPAVKRPLLPGLPGESVRPAPGDSRQKRRHRKRGTGAVNPARYSGKS